MSFLSTHGLIARYGDFQALYGIDFGLDAGEVVALIGAKSAGKSTFLKSVMGLLTVGRDMVHLDGKPVGGRAPHQMVQAGVAIVPEGRRLFSGMSVEDNLRVAIDHGGRKGDWTLPGFIRCFRFCRKSASSRCKACRGGAATDGCHRPGAAEPAARAAV